nr:MAG TPA: hypothetical protein [Caudoviricetes sp.]
MVKGKSLLCKSPIIEFLYQACRSIPVGFFYAWNFLALSYILNRKRL